MITRLTPEYTLEASVRLRTSGGAVAVRVPVGDTSAANVSINLADGDHTLGVTGYGLIPIEITSDGAHSDAVVFRGRLGLVVPPVVGSIAGTATHTARIHVPPARHRGERPAEFSPPDQCARPYAGLQIHPFIIP
jgi:hypothetical protein